MKIAEGKCINQAIIEEDALGVINALNGHFLKEEWRASTLVSIAKIIIAR